MCNPPLTLSQTQATQPTTHHHNEPNRSSRLIGFAHRLSRREEPPAAAPCRPPAVRISTPSSPAPPTPLARAVSALSATPFCCPRHKCASPAIAQPCLTSPASAPLQGCFAMRFLICMDGWCSSWLGCLPSLRSILHAVWSTRRGMMQGRDSCACVCARSKPCSAPA